MNIYLASVLFTALSVRATQVAGVAPYEQKSGSDHKGIVDSLPRDAKDFVKEGRELEFDGLLGEKHAKDEVFGDEDDYDEDDYDEDEAEALEFINNIFETSEQAKNIENFEDVKFDAMTTQDVNLDHRGLILTIPRVRCTCQGAQTFFNIEITVKPSANARLNRCGARNRRRLGNHINRMLLDLGVGDAGVGDDVVFLAKVCNVPITVRRLLLESSDEELEMEEMEEEEEPDDSERELMRMSGFLYAGGGPCRGCPGDDKDRRILKMTADNKDHRNLKAMADDKDHRKLKTTSYSYKECKNGVGDNTIICKMIKVYKTCTANGCSRVTSRCSSLINQCACDIDFSGFLMELNERIKQYMKDSVVPKNRNCCGTNPDIVVSSTQVTASNVQYGC